MSDKRTVLLVLLAVVLLGFAAAPTKARGRGSGDGWRSVRLCQPESCWAKHPDGWGSAPRERRSRR